ncbi:MAG: tetratricopeptide repeat protein [Spirochaetia bacterium]|nr:tetratricopeptide repeat protein [Spirochaetia bacterium]
MNINKKNMKNIHLIFIVSVLILYKPVFAEESDISNISVTADTASMNTEAVTQAQQGNYDQAINRLKAAVSIQDKNSAATYNNLGYTFLLKRDYPNAIENYKKAIERNPVLIPSLANLGKAFYESSQYSDAIVYGEKVIRLDPQNSNVREWLPSAYKKAAEKRMFELEGLKNQNVQDKKSEIAEDDTKGQPSEKKPMSKVEISGLLELAWNKKPQTITWYGPHTTIPFPVKLSTELWASPQIRVSAEVKNPNMGVSLPYFISSEENIGVTFHSKMFFYGLGIYFSQANFSYDSIYKVGRFIQNSAYPKRADTKLGLIAGFQKEFSSLLFYIYPNLLFRDPAVGPQSIEFDRALSKLEYRIAYPETPTSIIPAHFELAIGLRSNEFFITEYSAAISGVTVGHYIGWYDLYLDMSFGKMTPVFNKIPTQFGFLLGSRFYFQDFNNKEPFVFANGQGYAGLTLIMTPVGIVIGPPTYKSTSLLLDLYFKQMFISRIIVMEKIGTEISGISEPANSFFGEIGIAYTF